jgi:hypothetical protein
MLSLALIRCHVEAPRLNLTRLMDSSRQRDFCKTKLKSWRSRTESL